MKIYDRLTVLYGWFAGLILLFSAVALGWYYFTFDEKNLQAVTKARDNFYEAVQADWLAPETESMVSQVLAADADQFELMVLRTALGRWRLTKQAPSAYDRLQEQFSDGLWNNSFLNTLSEALEGIDAQWKSARTKAITRGGRVNISVVPVEKLGFQLKFPPGVTTAEIGSLLEVSFTVDNNAPPPAELVAIWLTALDDFPRPYRARHCSVEDTGRMHEGKKVYRATMDMSDSPEWLNPVVQITSIHFNPQVELALTALEYQVGDSNLLPVQ